ncbi:hypothetical protein Tco_0479529 [Tanacetum coccineum]
MEVLTLIIKRRIRVSDTFRYHNLCEDLQIVNVCFADDLFIFSRGEVDSARLIMESLEEFQKSLGIVPSIPKSTVYFCNVRNHVKVVVLNIMPFAKGELPVKYLGVPLISTSVLSSMQVFWASVLVIPKGIVLDIQQQIRGFLWCNGELKRGKAKVACDILCLPKCEGGLGAVDSKLQASWAYNLGRFNLQSCVADLVSNGGWAWPQSWLLKAPYLAIILDPDLVEARLDLP